MEATMKRLLKMMLAAALLGVTVFMAGGTYARAEEPTTAVTGAFPDGFDPAYYANKYADVKAVCGNDAQLLYNHYVMFGKKEMHRGAGALRCMAKRKLTIPTPALPGSGLRDRDGNTPRLSRLAPAPLGSRTE